MLLLYIYIFFFAFILVTYFFGLEGSMFGFFLSPFFYNDFFFFFNIIFFFKFFNFLISFFYYIIFLSLIVFNYYFSSFSFQFYIAIFSIFFTVVVLLILFFFYLIFFIFFWLMGKISSFFNGFILDSLLFSTSFLSLEDEDVWITSNFFYLDEKIIFSDDFNLTSELTVNDIEIFLSLFNLFFKFPDSKSYHDNKFFSFAEDFRHGILSKNPQLYNFNTNKVSPYNNFSKRMVYLKFFSAKSGFLSSYNKEIQTLSQTLIFFNYYRNLFRSNFVLKDTSKLRIKRRLKYIRKVKKVKSKFLIMPKFSTTASKNFDHYSNRLFNLIENESKKLHDFSGNIFLSRLKTFLNTEEKKKKYESRFLSFFWYSFPLYLVSFNFSSSGLFSRLMNSNFFLRLKRFFFFFYKIGDDLKEEMITFESKIEEQELTKSKNEKIKFVQKTSNINRNFPIPKISAQPPFKRGTLNYKRYIRRQAIRMKLFLSSFEQQNYLNIYNSSKLVTESPIRLLDLYKMLEYFYFVMTVDHDLHEEVSFSALVSFLKDKYGKALTDVLLNSSDHKQASFVSVIMHIQDNMEPSNSESLNSKFINEDLNEETKNAETLSLSKENTLTIMDEAKRKEYSKFVYNFARHLISVHNQMLKHLKEKKSKS